MNDTLALRAFWDGGVRNQSEWDVNGVAAWGWLMGGGFICGFESTIHWVTLLSSLLHGSVWFGSGRIPFEAELAGARGLAHGICHLVSCPGLEREKLYLVFFSHCKLF